MLAEPTVSPCSGQNLLEQFRYERELRSFAGPFAVKTVVKRLLLFIGLVLVTQSAFAGSFSITLLGFQSGGWQEGYPYYGNVNSGPVIDLMCDDYAHGGSPGQNWPANFTNLGDQTLAQLRFNQLPGALTLYDEAGWILLQTQVTPRDQWTDMNTAVWYLFYSNTPLDQGAKNWLAMADQEAQKGFKGINFNLVGIYTPVDQYDSDLNDPQEMMTIISEPSTIILLCTGLAGLLGRRLAS
jgi:hypothetical protein